MPGLHSTVANTANMAGIGLELAFGSKDGDATGLYVVQGLIVFVLGFDVLINAGLEFLAARPANIESGAKLIFYRETVIGVFLLPAMWLLLCTAVMSSHAYDCAKLPCTAKHYLYPVLFVFRNHRLYMSLFAFGSSMQSASTVLLLFLCFLLTTSAIGTLMLQGIYEDSGYYTNNQYVLIVYAGLWDIQQHVFSTGTSILVLHSSRCLYLLETAIITLKLLR